MKPKIALLALLTLCTTASALVYTPLNLPALTDNILTWTDGLAYAPLYPSSSQTLAGVPFQFQSDASGNNIFYGGSLNNPADATLHIPVNLYGVTTVYALVNTAWGQLNWEVGSIGFLAASGLFYDVTLTEGVNVRDHYYGGFVNTTTDPAVTEAVFGANAPAHAHYDMLTITLPSAFGSEVLSEIIFNSQGQFPEGKAFLAAATVATEEVPVPDSGASLLLLGVALGLIASRRSSRAW